LLILAVIFVWGVVPAFAVTEVSSCDAPSYSGDGILTGDLDCTATPLFLRITPTGSLDFQGFTLTNVVIVCGDQWSFSSARCNLYGPGTLVGGITTERKVNLRDLDIINGSVHARRAKAENVSFTFTGPTPNLCAFDMFQVQNQSRLKMRNVSIDGGKCGVAADGVAVRAFNVKITNSAGFGIDQHDEGFRSSLIVKDSIVSSNGSLGIRGTRVRVFRSTITNDGGDGVLGGEVGENSFFGAVRIEKCTITGNRVGVDSYGSSSFKRTRVRRSTISGNAVFGIQSHRAPTTITNSTVTGNGTSSECDVTQACADIAAFADVPKVSRNTTCDTSYEINSGIPGSTLGICSLD